MNAQKVHVSVTQLLRWKTDCLDKAIALEKEGKLEEANKHYVMSSLLSQHLENLTRDYFPTNYRVDIQ